MPEKVVLVDDVYTTGSTLQECSKMLKKAGAKHVEAIVLALG
jgi:predicted amidophosphoribosyltransferase